MTYPEEILGRKPDQIGILVPTLEEGAKEWGNLCGVDEWKVFTFSPETLTRLTFRGEEAQYAMRLALYGSGPQIEIIEPLAGPSLYSEWIERRGYGMHHVGYYVDSLTDGIEAMRAHGHEPIQTGEGFGADGTGRYAYFEPEGELGLVIELIEAAVQRRESETL